MSEPGRFTRLLSPLELRGATLRNRAIMGAMHTHLEGHVGAPDRIYAFYKARTEGEIAMIITGGIGPNLEGRLDEAAMYRSDADKPWHDAVIAAAAGTSALMCMQIIHAGRYSKHNELVAPSAIKSRIRPLTPRAMTPSDVWRTIEDFAATAEWARRLGYHAVEIMGSEGYLINEFTAPLTNHRDDEFGGSFENRVRFPLEIVKAVRARVGEDFPLMFRISVLDLVQDGMPGHETLAFARLLQKAGCDILNTGVGWHESTVPTVAYVVPRAAWVYAMRQVKAAVSIPVIAANRINDPVLAENLLTDGDADLISMARPLLADPDFMRKVRLGQPHLINTCIACNQGCLDVAFRGGVATCLVNPRAGHETEFAQKPPARGKRIAVVGGGAAGMNFAFNAAERGHEVVLYEASAHLGGQLLMARRIPDKTEFDEMLRYFEQRLIHERVELRLATRPTAEELSKVGYDAVVIATGVKPRRLDIPGITHAKVLSYPDVLLHDKQVGRRAAIIGAGGIGFDVAEFLLSGAPHVPPTVPEFAAEYGLDLALRSAGGLAPRHVKVSMRHEVTLLQRKHERLGAGLALSTGWIRRDKVKRLGAEMIGGVSYELIDDAGLHVRIDGNARLLEVDTVVICAGQESERVLYDALKALAPQLVVHRIGGADVALELDAMRAIDQATRLAMVI